MLSTSNCDQYPAKQVSEKEVKPHCCHKSRSKTEAVVVSVAEDIAIALTIGAVDDDETTAWNMLMKRLTKR